MPDYVPVSLESHGARRWKRPRDYRFAVGQGVVPLVFAEIFLAMMSLPVAFIARDGDYVPAALLGVRPGENLLVGPNGRWLGPYIPAAFRAWPFALVPDEPGRGVLCVARNTDLVVDDAMEGANLFFEADGAPSKQLSEVVSFLQRVSVARKATAAICAVLRDHGLIEPWLVTLPGDRRQLTGLHRIREQALNTLPGDALAKVRDCGGLVLAYGQLLSMNHLHLLFRMAAARSMTQSVMSELPITPSGELDLEFLNDSPTVRSAKSS